MSISLNIKKGLDLNLEGQIESPVIAGEIKPTLVGICSDDFHGLIPKTEVKEGDKILAGDALLRDKNNPRVKIVSPVAGTVKAIVRGERRKIMNVVVEADYTVAEGKSFDVNTTDRAQIIDVLAQSGLFSMMVQRPYGVVPSPDAEVRDIYVMAADTAPLAPSFEVELVGKEKELAKGVEVLSRLTAGKVYVARHESVQIADIPGAEMIDIKGHHPATLPGTVIANTSPINKGEIVWTLDGVTLARIGGLFLTGKVDWQTIVALVGSEVKTPGYVKTVIGGQVDQLLSDKLKTENDIRIISGNVLTGKAVTKDEFLRVPYTQITVIPEGSHADEFMGWASMSPSKMSVSRSFPGHFLGRKFAPDARLLGGRRAMIMSGEYDSVMPMDIMPEYLIKAILSRDIDKMEQLGIYEVIPEDFALAEYVDTSKLELQKIVSEGLDFMRKETE